MKMLMQGKSFGDSAELVRELQSATESIPKSTLENVFGEWMQRLGQVIESEGEYVAK